MRNCPEIISTFQDATRYSLSATRCPLPATRKGQTVYAFAGSGQRAAGSVPENVEIN